MSSAWAAYRGMPIGLAAIGLTSTVAQVVLMRELVATFYGSELLFGLVLAAWLAWVAVGSWGLARLPCLYSSRLRGGGVGGQRAFAAGLALGAALFPAEIILVRGVRTLLGTTPGALVELGPLVAAVVVILAPLCLLTGVLFTWGARLTVERGGLAGQAYVWESIGAVGGGALFSFALIRWLDPFQTALLVSATNLTIAIRCLKPETWGLKLSLASFTFLTIVAFPVGRMLHNSTLSWQWSDLVFAADSPYGRLTVQARDGQRVFFENGLLAFETQGTFPEEVAHFPLLIYPYPQEVLLIGGGVAGDVREILKHPVSSVTYVELDPLLIEAAQAHLPSQDRAVLADARVTLVLTDGRLYVQQYQGGAEGTERCGFDVVILDLPEPFTGALNRFYTREFFSEVRAVLNPGGVFALGLPSAENYWSPELARRNGSVYHTLRAVFPEVAVLPGEHNFFLASDVPLQTDVGVLTKRLAGRSVETRWVTPSYIEYVFTTDRFTGVQAELAGTVGVRLNRDMMPVCYYYDLALWLSRFYPNLRSTFESASLINLWWVVVPLAVSVLVTRWRRRWAVPFAIATIGLAEMALEVVILFAFQVLHGTVYSRVSLVVTAFMAGLALGGAWSNRLLAGWEGARRETQGEGNPRRALIVVQGGVVVYSGLLPLVLSLPISLPAAIFPLLALLAGGSAGAAFPLAVALVQGNADRAAGMLYGADLVGGCAGALVGALLFVPVLGIPQTCVAILLVGLAGLLALL
jgi:spermidine synthase